jgi:hypothetical protein
MLTRLLKTGQEIQLNIQIVRVFGQADLIPGLCGFPPPSLSVTENHLVNVHVGHCGNHALETVRIINLSVNVLNGLQKPLLFIWGQPPL